MGEPGLQVFYTRNPGPFHQAEGNVIPCEGLQSAMWTLADMRGAGYRARIEPYDPDMHDWREAEAWAEPECCQ